MFEYYFSSHWFVYNNFSKFARILRKESDSPWDLWCTSEIDFFQEFTQIQHFVKLKKEAVAVLLTKPFDWLLLAWSPTETIFIIRWTCQFYNRFCYHICCRLLCMPLRFFFVDLTEYLFQMFGNHVIYCNSAVPNVSAPFMYPHSWLKLWWICDFLDYKGTADKSRRRKNEWKIR